MVNRRVAVRAAARMEISMIGNDRGFWLRERELVGSRALGGGLRWHAVTF
jgi:hypothetical protein